MHEQYTIPVAGYNRFKSGIGRRACRELEKWVLKRRRSRPWATAQSVGLSLLGTWNIQRIIQRCLNNETWMKHFKLNICLEFTI